MALVHTYIITTSPIFRQRLLSFSFVSLRSNTLHTLVDHAYGKLCYALPFVRGEHISTSLSHLSIVLFNMRTALLANLAGTALARNVPSLNGRDVASYTYLGCYQDSTGKRTLRYPSNRDYNIQTVETCTSWCSGNKYNYCVSTAT